MVAEKEHQKVASKDLRMDSMRAAMASSREEQLVDKWGVQQEFLMARKLVGWLGTDSVAC